MTWAGLSPPYATLLIDAPWRYPLTQRHRAHAARQYSTMTPAELAALPVGELLAEDAHVWLWLVNRALIEGWHLPVLEAWGLRPQGALLTWCKTGQPGVGAVARANTEHLLLAVKGSPPVPESPLMSTWFTANRVLTGRHGHSRKPAMAMDWIEQVSPGPYCELFARQQRLNWAAWGLGHESPLVSCG
jgi:N6-adenosine-specific RNA methylase IME4